jgi:hypothetical protein
VFPIAVQDACHHLEGEFASILEGHNGEEDRKVSIVAPMKCREWQACLMCSFFHRHSCAQPSGLPQRVLCFCGSLTICISIIIIIIIIIIAVSALLVS